MFTYFLLSRNGSFRAIKSTEKIHWTHRKNCMLLSTDAQIADKKFIIHKCLNDNTTHNFIPGIAVYAVGFYDNYGRFQKFFHWSYKTLKNYGRYILETIKDKSSVVTFKNLTALEIWNRFVKTEKKAGKHFNLNDQWMANQLISDDWYNLFVKIRRGWREEQNLTEHDCRTYETQTARDMIAI